MAIAGLLVHCLRGQTDAVSSRIAAIPSMMVHSAHQDQYIVVVAETPSSQMEKEVEQLEEIEGILAVYTTYLTTEDEISDVRAQAS